MRAFCGVRALALLFESLSVSIYVRRYMCVLGVRICVCVLGCMMFCFFVPPEKIVTAGPRFAAKGKGGKLEIRLCLTG